MNKHYLTAILLGCLWMPLGVESAQTCSIRDVSGKHANEWFDFTSSRYWIRCYPQRYGADVETLSGGAELFDGDTAGNYLDDTCTTTAPSLNLSWQAALR